MRFAGIRRRHHFESYVPSQAVVARFENLSHAGGAKRPDHFVRAKRARRHAHECAAILDPAERHQFA